LFNEPLPVQIAARDHCQITFNGGTYFAPRVPEPSERKSNQKYLKFGNEDEIGKTMSPAKAQRRQGSENSKNLFNFAPWRLGGINFP